MVDEDYGQLEVIDDDGREMYPITYPAVLIDLEQVDWSELAGKSQMGEARLKIRLIIDCYDDTHSGSGTEVRIIEREELRKRLHGLLEGCRPTTESSGLKRVESKFYTWFQFTHPGRGATPNQSAREYELTVSIHAPREGCDRARWRIVVRPSSFQFTHPGRGATQR